MLEKIKNTIAKVVDALHKINISSDERAGVWCDDRQGDRGKRSTLMGTYGMR